MSKPGEEMTIVSKIVFLFPDSLSRTDVSTVTLKLVWSVCHVFVILLL